jgi:hypothetical protein
MVGKGREKDGLDHSKVSRADDFAKLRSIEIHFVKRKLRDMRTINKSERSSKTIVDAFVRCVFDHLQVNMELMHRSSQVEHWLQHHGNGQSESLSEN